MVNQVKSLETMKEYEISFCGRTFKIRNLDDIEELLNYRELILDELKISERLVRLLIDHFKKR